MGQATKGPDRSAQDEADRSTPLLAPTSRWPSRTLLLAVAFVEGFASLGIEITALRRLVPHLGSSITITAPTIGLFLVALAAGYWSGGRVPAGHLARLQRNFLIAAAIAGVGLASGSVGAIFSSTPTVELGYLVFMSVVVCPSAYLLAQTVPLITNLIDAERPGAASGQVLAASTGGSVIGASGLPVLVMPIMGVGGAAWICASSLLIALLPLLVAGPEPIRARLAVVMLVASMVTAPQWMPGPAMLETAYADYAVVAERGNESTDTTTRSRWLLVNRQLASKIDDGDPPSVAAYIVRIRSYLLEEFGLKGKRILVLGAGGFTLSMGDTGNEYVYVDIDPAIREVAETHFLEKAISGSFVAQDARRFLLDQREKFDAIVVDVYSAHASVPAHLVTREFWRLIPPALTRDGIVMVNIIADAKLRSPYARHTLDTIESALGRCLVDILKPASPTVSNIVLACRPVSDAQPVERRIYTDEVNRVDSERGVRGY